MATTRLGGQPMVRWSCALGFGEPDRETLAPLALADRVRVVLVERAGHVRGAGDLLDQLAPGGTGGIGGLVTSTSARELCVWCGKIMRPGVESWHGICPQCLRRKFDSADDKSARRTSAEPEEAP